MIKYHFTRFRTHLLLALFLVLAHLTSEAQVFVERNVAGTANTSFQFTSTSARRTQNLYLPSELGNPTVSGTIDTIYFMRNTTTALTHTDLEIYIGQTAATALTTNLDNNFSNASAVQVFGPAAFTIPAGAAGTWAAIPLTTLFPGYDPSLAVFVETRFTTNPSSTTWAVRTGASDPSSTNRKAYSGTTTGSTGTLTTTRANFAFFVRPTSPNDAALTAITSPTSPSAPGNSNVVVTISNFGSDTLSFVSIGWEIDGAPQSTFNWTGIIPPLASESNVVVGSFNFADGVSNIKAWTFNPNNAVDGFTGNDTAQVSVTFCAPLAGAYTINSALPTGGINFQTFNDFAARINQCGVTADVTASVVVGSGPYTEQVVFFDIPGTGPNARVTIEGNGETITSDSIIQSNNPASNPNRHIIRLHDISYFTINNLVIDRDTNNTASAFMGIHLFNDCNNVVISNCTINMNTSTSSLVGGIIASGSESSILTTGNFHDITITGNTTSGGGYGVSIFGLANPLASNVVISNNTLLDYSSNAIYLRETIGAKVAGNTINKRSGSTITVNAIQIAQSANQSCEVSGNIISMEQTAGSIRGIYFFGGTGHKAFNNVIYDIRTETGSITAFEARGGAPEIYHNTVLLDNPNATTGNITIYAEGLSNVGSILKNNIFSIRQTSTGNSSVYSFSTASSNLNTAVTSNHNIYTFSGGVFATRGTTTFATTLADWQQNTTHDAASRVANPMFASSVTLPLLPQNPLIDNGGTPITFVTEDILGNPRSTTTPDYGAYEFCVPPAKPDTIFGDTLICINQTGVVFTIDSISDATSYEWSVPNDATITSGQGTKSISVDFGTIGGNVSAKAVNVDCGAGAEFVLSVNLKAIPDAPSAIEGDSVLCAGSSGVVYEISPVSGALGYVWTVPADAVIQSGQGTSSITVDFGNDSGDVEVYAEGECGNSSSQSLAVRVSVVPAVSLLLPTDPICLNSGVVTLIGGSPSGGDYSGIGVAMNGDFDPTVAGIGKHEVTYTFTNSDNCFASATDSVEVDVCSNVNNALPQMQLAIFPNPVEHVLNIHVSNFELNTNFKIVDVTGRIALRFEIANARTSIDVSALQPGVYLITADSNSINSIRRFVKN